MSLSEPKLSPMCDCVDNVAGVPGGGALENLDNMGMCRKIQGTVSRILLLCYYRRARIQDNALLCRGLLHWPLATFALIPRPHVTDDN